MLIQNIQTFVLSTRLQEATDVHDYMYTIYLGCFHVSFVPCIFSPKLLHSLKGVATFCNPSATLLCSSVKAI